MQPQYIPYADISLLKNYELPLIEKVFKAISYDWGIEFNFPHGGCQQRAQLISLLLKKKYQIEHYKIWLFAPAALYLKEDRMLQLVDKNYLSPNGNIEWSFHVAPVVNIKTDNGVETYIIDPSVDRDKPLLLRDWLIALGNSHTGQYSFLLPEKYFFNSSYHTNEDDMMTMLFDGSFYDYVNPAKDNLAVEKGLAINDMVKIIYDKYIAPVIQRNQEIDKLISEDLKAIFGNATALDMLFSQNISGYTENTTLRYVMTNYGSIVEEARDIFNHRLYYWTKVVNELL